MKMPRFRAVGGQAVLLALSAGAAQLGIAALFVLAARATDPSALGAVASAMALGVALSGIVDFGSNAFWVRELARGAMTPSDLGRKLLSKLVIGAAAAGALTGVLIAFTPETLLWTAGILGLSTLIGQSAQTPLRGAALGDLASLVVVFDRLVAVLTYFALTSLGLAAPSALIAALATGPVASAFLAAYLTPPINSPAYRNYRFRWPWTSARNFGVSAGFLSLQSLDVALLGSIAGPAAAGIYGSVNKWVQPVSILAGSFASASAPFIARAGNVRDSWRILRQAAWMPSLAIIGAGSLAILSPWLVETLLGSAYGSGAQVLTILAIAAIPGVLNQPLFIALQYLGRDRAVAIVLSSVIALQLALVAALAPSLGALSCAVAVLASQMLQLLAFLFLTVREVRQSRDVVPPLESPRPSS
ncbi:lipopolysaccharide biosynthesis protein [Arthrobacter agilis]|uniref:lipopolysaccharide biosynthesis protein n=1 Tax=Arthrobacter agilis TaxID=37921 RepID=UPI002789563F|nr:hypothetical protein [Arthrobacter agilis]MDQ0734048.1 O-antigen/teichoic acid export membrane protein [Arthrobacter agilis]